MTIPKRLAPGNAFAGKARHALTSTFFFWGAFLGLGGLGLSAPLAVTPVRGQYCAAFAPAGWHVVAENAVRSGFGADLLSGDGRAYAGYSVGAAGNLNILPGHETPDRAVRTETAEVGRLMDGGPTSFGRTQQLGPNTFLVEYQHRTWRGVVFYQVFPAGRGGYMIVSRAAQTAIAAWVRRAGEASAVARSLHCNVPSVPAQPDPPELNGRGRRPANHGQEKENDSLYNQWLDKEYYHDERTGENFWVSPSTDWAKSGPEGEGYYRSWGNEVRKLAPGYHQ